MDAVDENRNKKRVNGLEVHESLHVGERFPQDRGLLPVILVHYWVCPKSTLQFCPGLLYQENNSRSVLSTSHAPRVTDRGQPCLREEVEVVSRPKDIQWTRWTRIETGNELMT
ncbi:hypothetical protein CDAR_164141 [Caerostris darwini]|uniref:Uncharacterized protein n=1 Tax=Caerostris darwini TaxID=1538125 RepID=A0AAV4X803_9ARAC|nr:hypothetical protein CDAR_164141 [Caerostris darwini]